MTRCPSFTRRQNGIIQPDAKTMDYTRARTDRAFSPVFSAPDARYHSERVYDVSAMEPVVAKPHAPDNKAPVSEVAGTKLDRAYIGSCTGGKLEDFVAAARILKGQEVTIDTYVVPATTDVRRALWTEKVDGETLADIFENAGAKIGLSSCAACLGGPVDTFGRTHGTEVVISTTNRNYPGRMGSKQSAVFLASALTTAASALSGVITDPRDVLVA